MGGHASSAAMDAGARAPPRDVAHSTLRARLAAIAGALGGHGVAWGLIALLLLVGGLASATTALVLSARLTSIDDGGVTSRLADVHQQVQHLTTDLLVIVTDDAGSARLTPAREAWRRIALDLSGICELASRPGQADRSDLMAVCARFGAAGPMISVLLSADVVPSPSARRMAVGRVVDLAGTLRSFEDDRNRLTEGQRRRLDEQKRLLVILSGAAAGGLLSGMALAFAVGASAAGYRRRWLAAVEAERAASETRSQLVEAIEAIPVGFGLYDRDGRLMMFNDRLAGMNRAIYTPALIGRTHREIVEAAAASQPDRWASDTARRAWIDRQLERFRDGRRGDLQDRGDGRWFEFFEIRTPSGLTASIRHDVTDHKLYQRRLEASEQRYRDLVDSLVDVVFSVSPEGRFSYVSAAATRMVDLPVEAVVGRTVASVIHPDDMALFGALARAARRAPEREHATTLRIGGAPDRMRYCEVRFRATGERNAIGHMGFTGIVRDVHERILMERRQRDDTMKLRSIVESAGALIALVDRDWTVVLANRTFLAATGDAGRDAVGQPIADIVPCAFDRAMLERWIDHDVATALDPVEFDAVLPMADGGRRIVRMTASPVQDEEGRVNYILFLGVDETARRSAEVQLLDAARLATVGQMATGIAHEINQPLTVIAFSAESLLDDVADGVDRDDPAAFREGLVARLGRIEDQTHRAASIVRQLRIFARPPEEAPAAFDVAQALHEGVDLMREQLRAARFDVDLDIAEDLPAVVGHPNRLQQVLVNLLVNARDAVEEARARQPDMKSGRRIGVQARRAEAGAGVTIEVTDNGPGIPPAVLPRLFEPFFTTKASGKGTGLGLSISSEIVREMSGTIAAANRDQGGAVIRVDLPAAG